MITAMTPSFERALADVTRLTGEKKDAERRNDTETVDRLQAELQAATWRLHRLSQSPGERSPSSRSPSARERAVAALTELGAPSAPKAIAAYAEAKTGERFEVRWMASTRRDEFRSWSSGSKRDVYIVPALEGRWFAAGRGCFALSHWPLWQRIIGPLTPRADHLRTSLRLARQIEALGPQAENAARMYELLRQYVRSVPGALDGGWDRDGAIDLGRVSTAVEAELSVIQDEDEASRKNEAERATRQLDEQQLLWGGVMPNEPGAGF